MIYLTYEFFKNHIKTTNLILINTSYKVEILAYFIANLFVYENSLARKQNLFIHLIFHKLELFLHPVNIFKYYSKYNFYLSQGL